MTRSISHAAPWAAFAAGLAAIAWVAAGYLGARPAQPLALAITAVVATFYLLGAHELWRFRQATASLDRALADLTAAPSTLAPWLATLPSSLAQAVRQRIEGQRVALPGLALTPYLAGLLVLLGMLGSFLGMVVTLNGTGAALESASDLNAIRASLAAPVKGLGLAFGTSVAGVAASAMLGLAAALARRERLAVAQRLDDRIATVLHIFAPAHRRAIEQAAQQEAALALQRQQADAMPALIEPLIQRLQALTSAIERQSGALNERLLANQDRFHAQAEAAYTGLATSVAKSLDDSLHTGARAAGVAMLPLVEATMNGIARESTGLHARIEEGVQRQLDAISARLEATNAMQGELWSEALAEHRRQAEAQAVDLATALDRFTQGFEQRAASLAQSLERSLAERQAEAAAQHDARLAAWASSLDAMSAALQQRWQQAGADEAQRQQATAALLARTAGEIAEQLRAQAQGTIGEVARLVEVAAEAPRAAAEVIVELRGKLADSMQRDNALLDERARVLGTLDALLSAVNHAATEQRSAIDALVSTSADLLERAGSRFAERVDSGTGQLAELGTQLGAQLGTSAAEVASLGEAFGFAVQLFTESNDKLAAQLQRIEAALGKSLARSDEQLAYYVAQAREVIDLSIGSQKQIVEDLQQLALRRTAEANPA